MKFSEKILLWLFKKVNQIESDILCREHDLHDFKPYQVYRHGKEASGYTPNWRKCIRCGKELDEYLDPVEGKYRKSAEKIYHIIE